MKNTGTFCKRTEDDPALNETGVMDVEATFEEGCPQYK